MDSPDEDDQMRQMMGFSSFGGNKRPKHNPKRVGAASAPGTSTNLTPLGNRSTPAANTPPKGLPPRPPVAMPTYEQDLDEEKSQWVAARLPNPSPPIDERNASNGDDTTTHTNSVNLTHPPNNYQLPTIPETTQAPDRTLIPSPSLNVQAPSFHPKPVTSTHDATNTTTTTTTTTPTATTSTPFSKNDIRSDPTYWTSMSDKTKYEDTIAYTSPWTGTQFTRKELKEYSVGKAVVRPDGEELVVYFKPSFIEEGIWDDLEGKGREGEKVR